MYYESLMKCKERYLIMVENAIGLDANSSKTKVLNCSRELRDLRDFIHYDFHNGIIDGLPLNKLNRWLGYIQGCLIWSELTTVEDERNWTRPLFRPLDYA